MRAGLLGGELGLDTVGGKLQALPAVNFHRGRPRMVFQAVP